MNKILNAAFMIGSLLVLQSPEAAAHPETAVMRQLSPYYQLELRHGDSMPRWLKRNRSFRHWYTHTSLRRNRYLAWHQLFDIYRWETIDRRKHRKVARYRIAGRGDHYRHDRRGSGRRHKR